MSRRNLRYLDYATLQSLKDGVKGNLARYRNDGFSDLAQSRGWALETNVQIDTSYLAGMTSSGSSATEDAENSVLVWKALSNLTPALATENRVWTRLSHVEAFSYSQARWISRNSSDEKAEKEVSSHFFANSLTKYRDDHAVGRLWWNAKVAILLRGDDFEKALELICKKADIRQALMERSMTFSRLSLGRAILRGMERIPESTVEESKFRKFMKQLNLAGGGIAFETMQDSEIDKFIDACWRLVD